MKQVKDDFSSKFEKYFPSLRTFFDFKKTEIQNEQNSGLIKHSKFLGIFLFLLLVCLTSFLFVYSNELNVIHKYKSFLNNKYLDSSINNPFINISSISKIGQLFNFICSKNFIGNLSEIKLQPIDDFVLWQFRVKSIC